MPQRLEYYRQQRDEALQHAKGEDVDREGWLRIANEWQKLIDAAARQLGVSAEKPTVLDS